MSANFRPNQNDYNNMTPFKTWLKYQINTWGLNSFPFVESDFDDLTNYAMMMKLMKHFNILIENQNMVEEDMTKLYNAFTELQNYVNTYFDETLPELVNNKLDEMAEDGTLDNIVNRYIDNRFSRWFDNVSTMKSDESLANGMYANTLGYYNKNDNGNALYKIRTKTNDDIVDEMSIIALNDNTLIAEIIVKDFITPEMFGAKGDGTTDDTDVFKALIAKQKPIKLSSKTYLITDTLVIDENHDINIDGTGNSSIIKYTGEDDCIQISAPFIETNRNLIKSTILTNFKIISDRINEANAIHIHGRENSFLENITIEGFNGSGLKLHTRESSFINIRTRYNGDYTNQLSDIYIYYDSSLGDRSNDNHFVNCEFIYSLYNIFESETSSEILFDNCMFHNMPNSIMTDVYPNIYPNTSVTPTATYNTCVNALLTNSDSYAFSNCTFRIGGTNIIKLDNSPRNKMVNCNLSSFKVWNPAPHVVNAINSSSLLMNNITFGDIGYIFENDNTSNVIVGNHIIQTSSVNQTTNATQQMKNFYPVLFPEVETEKVKARYGNLQFVGGKTGYSNFFILTANNENNTETNSIVASGSNTNRRTIAFQENTLLKLPSNHVKHVTLQSGETQRAVGHGLLTDNFICIALPSWNTNLYVVSKSSTTATIRFGTAPATNDEYIDVLFLPL